VPDPYRHIRPGEVVSKWPRQAWNEVLDALKGRRTGGNSPAKPVGGPVEILIKNESGEVLERFAVLQPGEPQTLPSENEGLFKDQDVLRGSAPAAGQPFVIVQEPMPPDGFGVARIAGITKVQIDMVSEDHTFADAIDDDVTALESAVTGPARIIWVEPAAEGSGSSGSGLRWAVVQLGGAGGGDNIEVVEPRPGSSGSSGSGTQLLPYRIAVPDVDNLTWGAGEDILFWDANDS
jgi:hypothetical protein